MKCDLLLFVIYFGVFICDINASFISSFYPQFAEEVVGIQSAMTGLIFASYSVGMLITTMSIGKFMRPRGRKRLFAVLGLLFQALGLGLFIILYWLEKQKLAFVIISFVGRVLTGIVSIKDMSVKDIPLFKLERGGHVQNNIFIELILFMH